MTAPLNSSPERDAAEARKFLAEADRAAAEARKFLAEAEKAEHSAALYALDRRERERMLALEVAGDSYHHVYRISDTIDEGSVTRAIDTLMRWHRADPGCEIEIVFNSPGGSVIEGMALFDTIQMLRRDGHKVTTVALGMAASMAGVLLQAGDVRVMARESWLMIHEAAFLAYGKTSDVEDKVDWGKRIQDRILGIFASRSTLSKAQIKAKWTRKDWWINSDEALTLGLVDEVR